MGQQSLIRSIKENTMVRTLLFPVALFQAKILVRRYQRSEDSLYIKELKNIHMGKRCFVIGNGPSLRLEDLEQLSLSGEICFGTNLIYQIFPQTNWRPDYYICMDTYAVSTEMENIKRGGHYPKFINFKCASCGRQEIDNIHFLCTSDKIKINPYKMVTDTLSSDLSKYSTKTATVTVSAMELAIYMGFTTIYLLGVDNHYALQRLKNGKIHSDPSMQSSYFNGIKENKKLGPSVQVVDYMNESYMVCKKFADEHGVKIYNATRGGKLEVFPRVDFDSLFPANQKK